MYQTVLITGVNGQVGHALSAAFGKFNASVMGMCPPNVVKLSRADLDFSNVDAIRLAVQTIKPDLIINPAAYTAVDKAESEPALAHAINALAPQILAEEAAKLNAKLIHFSTDYVFDGQKTSAYVETDATHPLNVYGKSKLAGELAIRNVGGQHLIFRTSWVYGAVGQNFLKTILRLSQTRESLNIVADQFGAPTSSQSIADATLHAMLNWQTQSGIYHMVNAGETTWHGFAQEIVKQYWAGDYAPSLTLQADDILPIPSKDYPVPAVRPPNSRLNTDLFARDFGLKLCIWQKALSDVLNTLPTT